MDDPNLLDCSEIDQGWDELVVPALKAPKPKPLRTKSKEKVAAKAAKKAARKAARQAERKAREQDNNRAARKAVATKAAKRQHREAEQPASPTKKGPKAVVAHAGAPRSPAQVGSSLVRRALVPLAIGLVVLAALGWFLWRAT